MSLSKLRRVLPLLVLLAAFGCGDEDSGGSSTPTGPTTGNTPSNPPPSGVALIGGSWSGTSDFQQNGVHSVSNFTGSITQNDRQVTGTIQFTSAGWTDWRATFNGTVAGTSPDTQFVGDITVESASSTGTGICTGQMRMAGRSISNSMRWESPQILMASNVPTQPISACRGALFTPVWIFFR